MLGYFLAALMYAILAIAIVWIDTSYAVGIPEFVKLFLAISGAVSGLGAFSALCAITDKADTARRKSVESKHLNDYDY